MSNKYFSCQTDKAPYAYRCGETVRFHIQYREDGKTVPPQAFVGKSPAISVLPKKASPTAARESLHSKLPLTAPAFFMSPPQP